MTLKAIWQPPTRRAFVTMLGLGATALAVMKAKSVGLTVEPTAGHAPTEPTAPTLWIGHC
jgi:hypothetical protein